MPRLPASVAASTVFHHSPFAFAHNRPSRAVDDEMDGSSRWDAAEFNRERLTSSGERGVVGGCEIDTHQRQDRPQEAFRLAQGHPEDKAERQRRLDRTVRERLRRAWSTGRRRAPRVRGVALVRGCGQADALHTVEPVTSRGGTRRVCQARSSGSERDTRARPHAVAPMNCVPEDSRRRSTCTGRTHAPRARADGNQTPSSTVAVRAPSPS